MTKNEEESIDITFLEIKKEDNVFVKVFFSYDAEISYTLGICNIDCVLSIEYNNHFVRPENWELVEYVADRENYKKDKFDFYEVDKSQIKPDEDVLYYVLNKCDKIISLFSAN